MADHTSRRKLLTLSGTAISTALLAGCSAPSNDAGTDGSDDGSSEDDSSSDDGSSDDGTSDDGSSEDDSSSDDGSTDDSSSSDDGSTDGDSSDDGSSDDDGSTNGDSSDDGGQSLDPADWEGVDTIRLQSDGVVWNGAEPEIIADVENPTLVLFEGNEYEFIYENADGGRHNLELRDGDNEVIDGYSTELTREMGAELSFTAEATTEMSTYVCNPHSSSMVGDIQIE